MRRAAFVFGIVLATGPAYGGESPYNPGGNAHNAAIQYDYFCHSDSADGKLYLTQPKPAFTGKYDAVVAANTNRAWMDFMNKTYDRRVVRYPICEFVASAHVDSTFKSFIANAGAMHEQVVNVDWQYAP